MKRPQAEIIITEQGKEKQYAIYPTVKEAKKIARELALEKVRNGMQTKWHTDKVYMFPDGYKISVRKVYNSEQ